MLDKKIPFTQIFSSVIKPLVSEEKDRLLSLASVQELSNFIPDIDTKRNIDLLPIAFDACVVNRLNKNGDLIDTEVALATYKTFIHKFIDTEHDRKRVIGVILSASLSEFGTNKPLTEEDVKGKDIPFNITLGGVLWKAINGDLCDLVEDSNDPTSENYMKVSASWELGFSGFEIVELPQGSKNLSEGTVIKNPEQIQGIEKYLKCNGGSGVRDNKMYSRMPNQDVIAMGIGLTEKPAAEVQGIAAKINLSEASTEESFNSLATENINNISQTQQTNVKKERQSNMKITSIKDITDENLKQCSASAVTEFIASEIKKASEVYAQEQEDKMHMHDKLQKQHDELHKNVAEMKATIDALKKEKEDREHMDKFHHRMGEIHAKYNLPSDVAKHVAEDVKSCADEDAYAKFLTKAESYLRPHLRKLGAEAKFEGESENPACNSDHDKKDSGQIPHAKKTMISDKLAEKKNADEFDGDSAKAEAEGDAEAEGESEAKAEAEGEAEGEAEAKKHKKHAKASQSIASAVEDALDNAKVKGGLPNSSSATSPGLKEKYATAFAVENFVITK